MKSRTKNIDKELAALSGMREEDIDTSDIPEVKDWSGAVVGKFYRPIKEQVCLRLDADVLKRKRKMEGSLQPRAGKTKPHRVFQSVQRSQRST